MIEADGTILTFKQTVSIIGVSVVQRERVLVDAELSRALANVYGITHYSWIANDATDPEFNGNRSNLSSFQFEVGPALFTPQSQANWQVHHSMGH